MSIHSNKSFDINAVYNCNWSTKLGLYSASFVLYGPLYSTSFNNDKLYFAMDGDSNKTKQKNTNTHRERKEGRKKESITHNMQL